MAQKEKTQPFITPFVSLIALVIYSVFMAFQKHLYLSMLLPILFSLLIYHSYLSHIFKKLFLLNTLIVLICLTLIVQDEYTMALLIFLRSNMILLLCLTLFCDKNEFSIAIALHQFKLPQKFVSTLFFTTKAIFILKYELLHFKKTLLARGFVLKTNLLTYRVLAGCVGILVIKAINKASYLQKAMIIRNFNGKIHTLAPPYSLRIVDMALLILICICIVLKRGIFI